MSDKKGKLNRDGRKKSENVDLCIDKLKIAHIAWEKIDKKISITHMESIMNLFVEELKEELIKNISVIIPNFGEIKLTKAVPRKYHNIHTREYGIAPGNRLIKITLCKDIAKLISKHFDVDDFNKWRESVKNDQKLKEAGII